jgi:hypothetical protein
MSRRNLPYTPSRGGLLTLIHNKYSFSTNIHKISTPANISPYLQIINIQNKPLQPWLLLNLYLPSHEEDIPLIPDIQNTITHHINSSANHTIILCGDFNRDIALIGRLNNDLITPPQTCDHNWRNFVDNLNLTYIPTTTSYSRQGGPHYIHTSLIDGFFIKTSNHPSYHSHTNTELHLNSDHFPIHLHIPPNTLISKPIIPKTIPPPKLLNPIPEENITKFNIKFHENNQLIMNALGTLLQHNQLTDTQWQEACTSLDTLISNISTTLQDTCISPLPINPLTPRTTQQGGYLPRKLKKQWKKHLSTYHIIRKAIYITKYSPTWHTHPLILNLHTHQHVQIPPSPPPGYPYNDWIASFACIASNANKKARLITTKYSKQCVHKAISKYRKLYDTYPKRVNHKVFKTSQTTTLDSLLNTTNNILTTPTDIAKEIHLQQSIINKPRVPTCYYQPDHHIHCTCVVRQYPWHDLDGLIMHKRGEPNTPIHTYFTRETYDLTIKYLPKGKTPSPDTIPNSILKQLSEQFHTILFLFFTHCYKQQQIPASWKTSLTILLYKKGDSTHLTNYRSIALANTIYKLFTSTLTTILSTYGEKH